MPNIGPLELVFVLVIALLLLGPKRLPAAAQSLGRSINEFRRGLSDQGQDRAAASPPSDAEIARQPDLTATPLTRSPGSPASDPERAEPV